jgi:uracil-DNA glycosylase family 4
MNPPILIILPFPSSDDEFHKEPLSGRPGEAFDIMLSSAGLSRSQCEFTYVLGSAPRNGQIDDSSPEYAAGVSALLSLISLHNPRVIVPLGGHALSVLTGDSRISKWRGSVLKYGKSFVVPTYEPYMATKDGSLAPQIEFDLRKVAKILAHGYKDPVHRFTIKPDPAQFDLIRQQISAARHTSVDIETIRDTSHILSVQFAWSAEDAVCLINPFGPTYSPLPQGQHCPSWLAQVQLLINAAQEIEFHNGTFDVEQLTLAGIQVPLEKWTHDTMFCQRVLEPELPIGLDFCTSIYTDEPYYKDDGKSSGKKLNKNLWDYGCKDVICTWQTREGQEAILASDPLLATDYEYNHALIPSALEFQRNGLLVDNERLKQFKFALEKRVNINESMLKMLAGDNFNHRSPKQVQALLYGGYNLPKRTNRKGNITTDEDALVGLIHYCQKELETKVRPDAKAKWELRLEVLRCLLDLRECSKLLDSYINFEISDDGRVRHSIKIAGTETGRWAASLYVDGTGLNAQTFPNARILLPD